MIKDFYHKNAPRVSAMLPALVITVLAVCGFVFVGHDALAANVSSSALTTKATSGADSTTNMIKEIAKPVGTLVIVGLAVLMMFLGKQMLGKFAWVILALIVIPTAGLIVAAFYGFFS